MKIIKQHLLFLFITILLFKSIDASFYSENCPKCFSLLNKEHYNIIAYAKSGNNQNCASLCTSLQNSGFEDKEYCEFICGNYGGYGNFVQTIEYQNNFPIDLCQHFRQCPIATNSNGTIKSVSITPEYGIATTDFTISINYAVTKTLGAGMLYVNVFHENNTPFVNETLLIQTPVGDYYFDFTFFTVPSSNHPFKAGTYKVEIGFGENPLSPHGTIFDTYLTSFVITPSSSSEASYSQTGSYSGSSSYF